MPKKRTPVGSDEYMTTEDYDAPKYVEEEEASSIDFSNTSADLFIQLTKYMRSRGIKALAVPGGAWAGFELYALSSFDVDGLAVPSTFKYWRALQTTSEADRLMVKDAIQACASTECLATPDKKTRAKWLSFVESWTAYMSNENMSLAMIARGMQSLTPYRTRTFKGTSGHFVVVPRADWFSTEVQAVNPYDLLSILPQHEADMFMLNMGRVVCGHSSQEAAEGLLQHDYRYFCGIVGGANLGKSTLLERYIKPALVRMGCKVATWNLRRDNPFGWARRATADWYMLSDCLTKDTVNVISDPQQKILAAGESITTEEKGQGDITVEKPTAGGFVFLANGIDIPKLHILDDDGVEDRFKCLLCKEREELKKEYGQQPGEDPTALAGMTGLMWERLSQETGASTEVLAMWLLHCCAVRFLTACGYDFDESDTLTRVAPSKLKNTVNELTSKLRMSSSMKAKEDLVSAVKYGLAYALSTFRAETYKTLCDNIGKIEFSHKLLLAVARLTVELNMNKCPEWTHVFFAQQLAADVVRPFFKGKDKDFLVLHHTDDPRSAFEKVTRYMKTKRYMFGYPSHPVSYANLWHSALLEVPIIAAKFKADDADAPLEMQGYLSDYIDAFKELMVSLSK